MVVAPQGLIMFWAWEPFNRCCRDWVSVLLYHEICLALEFAGEEFRNLGIYQVRKQLPVAAQRRSRFATLVVGHSVICLLAVHPTTSSVCCSFILTVFRRPFEKVSPKMSLQMRYKCLKLRLYRFIFFKLYFRVHLACLLFGDKSVISLFFLDWANVLVYFYWHLFSIIASIECPINVGQWFVEWSACWMYGRPTKIDIQNGKAIHRPYLCQGNDRRRWVCE